MLDEAPRRKLSERTGRHVCIRCLAEVPEEAYFRNDHVCDACAADGDYPLASTPDRSAPTDSEPDPQSASESSKR